MNELTSPTFCTLTCFKHIYSARKSLIYQLNTYLYWHFIWLGNPFMRLDKLWIAMPATWYWKWVTPRYCSKDHGWNIVVLLKSKQDIVIYACRCSSCQQTIVNARTTLWNPFVNRKMLGRTRWFFPGTPASSHTNDPIAITSLSMRDIKIICRTCLSILVK